MIDPVHLILLFAPLSLAICLFVETSSWWVRALAPTSSIGLYVSRSNIYLYGGRFFSLAFTSLAAFWIESAARPSEIAWLLSFGMCCSALLQFALLRAKGPAPSLLNVIVWGLRLPPASSEWPDRGEKKHHALFFSTVAASFIFGLGIGIPLMAAVLVPEYRLSVSYLGQLINSVGTLVVLFLIDQMLFRSLDNGTLPDDVQAYSKGRIVGFFLAGVLFGAIALAVD